MLAENKNKNLKIQVIKEVQQTSGKILKRLSLWIDASFMPVNFVFCNQGLYKNFLNSDF